MTACVREIRSHQSTSSHARNCSSNGSIASRRTAVAPQCGVVSSRITSSTRPSSDRLRPSSASRWRAWQIATGAARARLERSRAGPSCTGRRRRGTSRRRRVRRRFPCSGLRPARRSPARRITRTRGSLGTSTGSGLASSTTRHSKLVTVCASTDRTASARYWGRPYVGTITVNFGGCTQLSNASRQCLASRRPATPDAALRGGVVVAGTGVDPVTPRFSGACSAD